MFHRRLISLAAGAILLALAAVPVAAGGSATVDVTAGLDEPPVAGEEREVRVQLLQHGVTPVNFGTVTLTAVLPETSEMVSAEATPEGAGSWTATIAFPTAGDWQLQVTHDELATPAAQAITVADSALFLPAVPFAAAGAGLLVLVLAVAVTGRQRRLRPAAGGGAPVEPSLPAG